MDYKKPLPQSRPEDATTTTTTTTTTTKSTPDLIENASAAATAPSKKRKAEDEVDVADVADVSTATPGNDASPAAPPVEKVDVATQLGLKIGDRLEVYWTICDEASDDDDDDGAVGPSDNKKRNNNNDGNDNDAEREAKTEVATMWWAASLVKNTGRTHILTDEELEEGEADDCLTAAAQRPDNPRGRKKNNPGDAPGEHDPVQVPVYELNYDPMPDYGYPDHSVEEVCFVSDHVLLNLSTQEMMTFKREGAPSPPTSPREELFLRFPNLDERLLADGNAPGTERIVEEFSDEDELRTYMNRIMEESFRKSGFDVKMKKLSPAKQRIVAEKIGKAKEALLGKMMRELNMMERGKKVLTGDVVRKCVGEMDL
ncbi:hypothetical protein ACHAXS_002548 [Conticribra weissflogii]